MSMTREKAKNILTSVLHTDGAYMDYLDSEDVEAIKFLASDERPHGEWRDFSDMGFVECPFCEHATNCDDNIEELHYCFSCGAELRKEGGENG